MFQQATRVVRDAASYAQIGWKHDAFVRADDEVHMTFMFHPDNASALLKELDEEDAKSVPPTKEDAENVPQTG